MQNDRDTTPQITKRKAIPERVERVERVERSVEKILEVTGIDIDVAALLRGHAKPTIRQNESRQLPKVSNILKAVREDARGEAQRGSIRIHMSHPVQKCQSNRSRMAGSERLKCFRATSQGGPMEG